MEKRSVVMSIALLAVAGAAQAVSYSTVTSCSNLARKVEGGRQYTLVLFHDGSSRSESAIELFKDLAKQAEDIDFVLADAAGSMRSCARQYDVSEAEVPLWALFEGDPDEFSHTGSTRARTVISFIRRHTGEYLGEERDYDDGYGPRRWRRRRYRGYYDGRYYGPGVGFSFGFGGHHGFRHHGRHRGFGHHGRHH